RVSAKSPSSFFFFSGTRRHTRFSRDWSSDVCSPALEPEALRPVTRDCIRQGLAITAGEYDQALARQAQLRAEWLDRLAEFDVILTPSAPGTAPEGHASTGTSVFNRTWSPLGWPCIHLPLGEGQHGLPLGVQCIGKPGRDLDLLTQAERIHPWLDRRRRQLPDSNHAAGTPR